jgi:hypothetical protein
MVNTGVFGEINKMQQSGQEMKLIGASFEKRELLEVYVEPWTNKRLATPTFEIFWKGYYSCLTW